jgi:hypothetical protein
MLALQRGTGGTIINTISAGSVLFAGFVSRIFETVALFEIVPLSAVTFIGIVISGKFILVAIAAVTVQVIVLATTVQLHGHADRVPLWLTPTGRVSTTVV